jgi:putative transposase
MCRVYGVTRAGYYAWRKRQPSLRSVENRILVKEIEKIHVDSRGTYGSPRVTQMLRLSGLVIGKNRVARLMQQERIRGRASILYRSNPGQHAFYSGIPNRTLTEIAEKPNRVWVGDVTYLRVNTEWRYMAVVMDKCSRKIIGWSMGRRRDVSLTLRALSRAVANRRPAAGLFFHSDRGIEYAAHAFQKKLNDLGIVQSMNRPSRMNDNGHMESFFHSMKSDVVHGRRFTTDEELLGVVRSYIPFYNATRLHSSLNYVSPATYEKQLGTPRCQ